MKAPAGLQQATVITAVALVHAVGLWALLGHMGHTLQPAASVRAPQVTMLMLLNEPVALATPPARPPPQMDPLQKQPPQIQPRPPQTKPAPPREARPVPPKRPVSPPPPVPADVPVKITAAEPVPNELPMPSSEIAPAAAAVAPAFNPSVAPVTAAPSAAEGKASEPVPMSLQAKAVAATGVTRRIEDVDYLRAPVLQYPSASRRYGEQGRVVLRVLVGPDGQPEKIELHEASAFQRLNEAAIEAARRALYKPYTEDGVAQPAWALVALSFQLRR